MSAAQYTLLDLSMPKFKFESGVEDLKDILMNDFKVLDVFDPAKADLSGISTTGNLFVSSIIHKSFISVDENGTEAAAATGIVMLGMFFLKLFSPKFSPSKKCSSQVFSFQIVFSRKCSPL